MLLVLLALVRFTLPAFDGLPCDTVLVRCNERAICDTLHVAIPLTDLAEVVLVGWRTPFAGLDTLARHAAIGREGRPDSLAFEDEGLPWTVYLVTRDQAGNWSCPSALVGIGPWPVAVEPGGSAPDFDAGPTPCDEFCQVRFAARPGGFELEVFDLRGRRLYRAARAGMGAGPQLVSFATRYWPAGLYFIRARIGDQGRAAKIIVLH